MAGSDQLEAAVFGDDVVAISPVASTVPTQAVRRQTDTTAMGYSLSSALGAKARSETVHTSKIDGFCRNIAVAIKYLERCHADRAVLLADVATD